MRKTPRRMGNSEARLHKMGNQKAKANLDRAIKNVESRIKHLEVKEKPPVDEKLSWTLGKFRKYIAKLLSKEVG